MGSWRTIAGYVGFSILLLAATRIGYATELSEKQSLDAPKWFGGGSISVFRNSNALQTSSDKQWDNYLDGDLTVGVQGGLPSEWTYKVYARALFDRFERVRDADDSFSLGGVQVGHDLFAWKAFLAYENRQYYVGAFGKLDFIANDFKVGVSRDLSWKGLLLTPHISLLYRNASAADATELLLDMSVDLELPFNDTWSLVSTPQFRQYWYLDGINQERRDSKYTTSLGLKYNFNKAVSMTTAVRYEVRTSNFSGRNYGFFEFGPEIDFQF